MQLHSKKLLYQKAASDIVLTKQNIGDNESFCSHVLFCYYPYLVEKLWKEYQVGIGVLTLKVFESRNKESKTVAKKNHNVKSNVCAQTMNRAFDWFYFSKLFSALASTCK